MYGNNVMEKYAVLLTVILAGRTVREFYFFIIFFFSKFFTVSRGKWEHFNFDISGDLNY